MKSLSLRRASYVILLFVCVLSTKSVPWLLLLPATHSQGLFSLSWHIAILCLSPCSSTDSTRYTPKRSTSSRGPPPPSTSNSDSTRPFFGRRLLPGLRRTKSAGAERRVSEFNTIGSQGIVSPEYTLQKIFQAQKELFITELGMISI